MTASKHPDPQRQLDDWPASWACQAEDLEFGRELVALLRPFVDHLVDAGLAPKTIARHLGYLWVIGGQIIDDLQLTPEDRNLGARGLLDQAITGGEAPLLHPLDEDEQARADATAKKLHRYLGQP